jgi:hypothetical protein
MLGFDAIDVVNIFAYRATDPKVLKKSVNPVGPDNDQAILESVGNADMTICAWGGHGDHKNRHIEIKSLLKTNCIKAHVLSLTAKGHPGHPLYLPYTKEPFLWTGF